MMACYYQHQPPPPPVPVAPPSVLMCHQMPTMVSGHTAQPPHVYAVGGHAQYPTHPTVVSYSNPGTVAYPTQAATSRPSASFGTAFLGWAYRGQG